MNVLRLLITELMFFVSNVPIQVPPRHRGIAAARPRALVRLLPRVLEVVGVHVLLRRGGFLRQFRAGQRA